MSNGVRRVPGPQITSAANPRLKSVAALRRRRERDARRQTLVEGYDELRLAAGAGAGLESVYWCADLFPAEASAHEERAEFLLGLTDAGVQAVELSRPAFEKIAYREGPDGLLAVATAPDRDLTELADLLPPDPLVLLAEGVEKPGNLGAMLRSADAAGVSAVIAADPVGDWGNPNVVRASKGTVFSVPVCATGTRAALDWLRLRGIPLVATTPDTDDDYADVDLTGPVAVAVGTERTGLTGEVLERADRRVRIPMVGRADSLNVSISAAVVLFEAVRQRRVRGTRPRV